MTRIAWVLTALGSILLAAVWYLFLFSPTTDEIADVRAATDQARDEATSLRAQAAQLRQVRENAPETEARIATARSLLPDESAMPSLLRQLQDAADESGVELVGVAPSAPRTFEVAGNEIVSIGVRLQVEGTYYQLVDLSRRLENPAITARGLKWNSTAIQLQEEDYPVLSATMNGEVFARDGFAAPAATVEGAPTGSSGGGDATGETVEDGQDVVSTEPEPVGDVRPEGQGEDL